MNVVLVGYRGTGKSAVARALGARLGWPVISTDALVERRLGRTIAQFVDENGWPAFRSIEREAVAEVAKREHVVIDTGGGAFLDPAGREALRAQGVVVWLRACPATIAGRIRGDSARPPLLAGQTAESEIVAVLAEREPLYAAAADAELHTDDETVENIAARIDSLLAGRNT